MLHQPHVLRQTPHGRAALAVERDGEEFAVAAGRDEGAEGLALEEADAGELGGRDAGGAGEEIGGGHGARGRGAEGAREGLQRLWECCDEAELSLGTCGAEGGGEMSALLG